MKKLAIVLSIVSCTAQAEFFTGNMLLEQLTSTSEVQRNFGLGFVIGVHDAHEKVTHCSPDSVTTGQVRDVVLQALLKVPEHRHQNAERLVWQILQITWPCKDRQNRPSVY